MKRWLSPAKWTWFFLLAAGAVLAWKMVQDGAFWVGTIFLLCTIFVAWTYTSPKTHASRYLLPGLATFAAFVLMPLLYTVYIAFTNFGGEHLLTQTRVQEWFRQDTYAPQPEQYRFSLYANDTGTDWRLVLEQDFPTDESGRRYVSDYVDSSRPPAALSLRPADSSDVAGSPLPMRDIMAWRPWLKNLHMHIPGQDIPLRVISLRHVGTREPLWAEQDETLVNVLTGQRLVPNHHTGNYVDDTTGEAIGPGWRVHVGFENFRLIFLDAAIRGPFLRIFSWNISFAFLSVFITFAVGVLLAALLQWKAIRGRAIYRTLLILPYAIPAFIPILVFRGLFNENFGEINLLLNHVFGIKPHWFTDPWLARTMILIVNTWLGYPYMMIISSGMLQTIPDEMYEATAIDGAGPTTNFLKITLPQILPPLFPLLIASFAFNFNNFNLIYLLTGGQPELTNSAISAGTTDLIVSYTYRTAFRDSAARFGFASAIATLLFIIVGVLAWQQLRISRRYRHPNATN